MAVGSSIDIRTWLEEVGLGRYADLFVQHEISYEVLPELTALDIDRLALPTGPRRQVIVAIRELTHGTQARRAEDAAERRQVTVMLCDLVGSTALSTRMDPEDYRALMEAYREICEEVLTHYDGHVAQWRGDAMMAYTGWPNAYEDAAERGVRAALDIVREVKKVKAEPALQVRIGLATGTVVVGAVSRADDAVARLAVGDTPNLAARLQELATPDEVIIASRTRRLVGGSFELTDLGTSDLKGITGSTQAWRVVKVATTPGRFEASRGDRLTPLVGRAEELALLQQLLRQADGGAGQATLVSGEAGIGKSRLISELRRHAEAHGPRVLRFQCSPYTRNSAFWPWTDHIERALDFAREDAPAKRLERLEYWLRRELERPLEDVRFIGSLASLPCEARYGPLPLTPQKYKEETLRALVGMVEAAARRGCRLLLFEDLHWVDPTTLEVLDLLMARLPTIPLLAVLTHRPEFGGRWQDQSHVKAISLSRLLPAQCLQMVSRLIGGRSMPSGLAERIVETTDGVPLFVEELTQSILESGQLKANGDRYEDAGAAQAIAVPATLTDSLMARLDRSLPVKEIAQIGAVIGREFSYEVIAAVSARPGTELEDLLERLEASGLVSCQGTPPKATFVFKHALVQKVAYESLLKSRRQKLHLDIARVLEKRFPHLKDTEPEVLAEHFTNAELFAESVPYWLRAGQNALVRLALTEAIAHLQQGLAAAAKMPPSDARDAQELECRVLLSTAWEAYGGWPAPQLAEVLKPALPLARAAGQPRALARALWGVWVQLMSVGPVAESLVWAQQLLDEGRQRDDEEMQIVGHMSVMVTNFWLGYPRVVEQHARAILARYDRARHGHIVRSMNHDPKTLAGIYLTQVLWMLGYPDQAVALVPARDAHAREVAHPFDTGFALTLGAWVFHYRREPEQQRARSETIQHIAQETGLPFLSEVLAPFLNDGLALAQQGLLAEGIEQMQKGIQYWEGSGAMTVTPYVRSRLGEALALQGDVAAGLTHVDAMLEQIAKPGWEERSHLAEVLRLKGWMLALKGDNEGAERSYRVSLDWAREQQAKSWELRTATSLARLWQAQSRPAEARALLAPVYDWFTEGFDTPDLAEARALLAALSGELQATPVTTPRRVGM